MFFLLPVVEDCLHNIEIRDLQAIRDIEDQIVMVGDLPVIRRFD